MMIPIGLLGMTMTFLICIALVSSRPSIATSRVSLCRKVLFLFLAVLCGTGWCRHSAVAAQARPLAPTPPMGWNDWAHYQCDFTAQTILDNANALVKTGLASRGYNTVTIDDCWMQKDRDAKGNLQPDPQRFPQGMKAVAQAVHDLGLKFGIYEDSGYSTCGGFAGSGVPNGGGKPHFRQDAKLFASWGVDYLKLDGCNLYMAPGESKNEVYRKAYKEQSAALKRVRRPIVFSESAPAYFQGTPEWYDVLSWVRGYGQLWREGSDVANYHASDPDHSRFDSVMWNYSYNLPLGRYQSPGNWNDADFIIGGDSGMTMEETRSQIALWSMMSAPLILSSDVGKLDSAAIAVLGNRDVIAIDQDPLGKMATLIRRTPAMDVLLKHLADGAYAVAVLNRNADPINVDLSPSDLGFAGADCELGARDLWSGEGKQSTAKLQSQIAAHDTAIWRIQPSSGCGKPARLGAVTRIVAGRQRTAEAYTRCLAAPGSVEACVGTSPETWIVTEDGALKNSAGCLTADGHAATVKPCDSSPAQRWQYSLAGDLKNDST
ncbi:MAG TPA: alpha-galactosidase, partial [Terracidiphilus sp.]